MCILNKNYQETSEGSRKLTKSVENMADVMRETPLKKFPLSLNSTDKNFYLHLVSFQFNNFSS